MLIIVPIMLGYFVMDVGLDAGLDVVAVVGIWLLSFWWRLFYFLLLLLVILLVILLSIVLLDCSLFEGFANL
jgi:hypothetical protein